MSSAQWHMAIGRVSSCWAEAPGAFHAPLLEWGHALRHQICRRTNIHHDFHNRIYATCGMGPSSGIHACTQKVFIARADEDAGPCVTVCDHDMWGLVPRHFTDHYCCWDGSLESKHTQDISSWRPTLERYHHHKHILNFASLTVKICGSFTKSYYSSHITVAVFVSNTHWALSRAQV